MMFGMTGTNDLLKGIESISVAMLGLALFIWVGIALVAAAVAPDDDRRTTFFLITFSALDLLESRRQPSRSPGGHLQECRQLFNQRRLRPDTTSPSGRRATVMTRWRQWLRLR